MQSLLLLMQFGRARAESGKSFVLAVEEPELHIQPSQQQRLVNRLNALCDQTIVTTHSPVVAAMFSPPETLFVATDVGFKLVAIETGREADLCGKGPRQIAVISCMRSAQFESGSS